MQNKIKIGWFHYWTFWKWKEFLLSNEVFTWSNANWPDSYVKDLYNLFIWKKLSNNKIDLKKFLLVIAHWKSTKNEWRIFWFPDDNNWILMEEFISYLPVSKNIILYVCNSGWYKLDLADYKIIYPKTNTWKDDLEFFKLNI